MKNKTLSKNDPYYLKIGKFKKKTIYDAKVDMSDQMENTFESLGREHITKEQYINIGFNYALIKGLSELKSKKK
jgi:hypothetical protein